MALVSGRRFVVIVSTESYRGVPVSESTAITGLRMGALILSNTAGESGILKASEGTSFCEGVEKGTR